MRALRLVRYRRSMVVWLVFGRVVGIAAVPPTGAAVVEVAEGSLDVVLGGGVDGGGVDAAEDVAEGVVVPDLGGLVPMVEDTEGRWRRGMGSLVWSMLPGMNMSVSIRGRSAWVVDGKWKGGGGVRTRKSLARLEWSRTVHGDCEHDTSGLAYTLCEFRGWVTGNVLCGCSGSSSRSGFRSSFLFLGGPSRRRLVRTKRLIQRKLRIGERLLRRVTGISISGAQVPRTGYTFRYRRKRRPR